MLIEVKARVAYIIDGKTKKKNDVFLLDREVFAEAEYTVMTLLDNNQEEGTVSDYEIQNLKQSPIKEVITTYSGEHSYIASLKDTFLDDAGNEKPLKYKIILWADSISQAMNNTREIAAQGYNMQIEGLKEVDYQYLTAEQNESSSED